MDSLSQIVLGAAVGEAALGKKVGNRAILWGAIAGTLPDMDVLLRFFVDEITATQWHRGFSHSVLFCVLCAPLLGWIAKKIHKRLEEVSFKSWLDVFLDIAHPSTFRCTNYLGNTALLALRIQAGFSEYIRNRSIVYPSFFSNAYCCHVL